jgi:hypothetical protein
LSRTSRSCCLRFVFILTIINIYAAVDYIYNNNELPRVAVTEFSCGEVQISEPIDVVYTWVNGSDPKFISSLNFYLNRTDETISSRYFDMQQLKYSLRSLEQFAPWIRNIFLVTNGQIPDWINLDRPDLFIITHKQIFKNKKHLPTFNSAAIEMNLHRIPNLSSKFLYFNDDVALLRPICFSDFYSINDEFILYPKDDITPYGFTQKIQNCTNICDNIGVCEAECNNPQCLYDSGDCDDEEDNDPRDAYHKSVEFVNYLLDKKFNTRKVDRKWLPHMPFLIDKKIIKQIEFDFGPEMELTSSHKSRMRNDIQYEMLYWYYIIESRYNSYYFENQETVVDYMGITNHYFRNKYHLRVSNYIHTDIM